MFDLIDRNVEWETRDGSKIKLKDMETSHVKNTLNMLTKKHGRSHLVKVGVDEKFIPMEEVVIEDHSEWIDLLNRELEYREKLKNLKPIEVLEYLITEEMENKGW